MCRNVAASWTCNLFFWNFGPQMHQLRHTQKSEPIYFSSPESPEKVGWQAFWDFFLLYSSGHFLDKSINCLNLWSGFPPVKRSLTWDWKPRFSRPNRHDYVAFPSIAMAKESPSESESEAAWLHYIVLVSTQYISIHLISLLISLDHCWSLILRWAFCPETLFPFFSDEKLQMCSMCFCQYSPHLRYRFNLCRAIPKCRAISVLDLNENQRIMEELTWNLPLFTFAAKMSIIVCLAGSGCSTPLQNEWLQP